MKPTHIPDAAEQIDPAEPAYIPHVEDPAHAAPAAGGKPLHATTPLDIADDSFDDFDGISFDNMDDFEDTDDNHLTSW